MSHEPQGLLRVPRLPDGALGRPRLHRVHRRHRHRRRARPQRPAALALLRDQGRHGGDGLRGRRARHPAPIGSLLKERLHPGRIFLVDTAQGRIIDDDGDQDRPTPPSTPTRSGCGTTSCDWPACPSRPAPARRPRHGARRGRSPSATRTRTSACCSAPWPRTARSRSAPWAPTPRWPCSPIGPRLLYDYFKQLFAQVTNPPLDGIREELVTQIATDDRARGQPAAADAGGVPPDRSSRPRS